MAIDLWTTPPDSNWGAATVTVTCRRRLEFVGPFAIYSDGDGRFQPFQPVLACGITLEFHENRPANHNG